MIDTCVLAFSSLMWYLMNDSQSIFSVVVTDSSRGGDSLFRQIRKPCLFIAVQATVLTAATHSPRLIFNFEKDVKRSRRRREKKIPALNSGGSWERGDEIQWGSSEMLTS